MRGDGDERRRPERAERRRARGSAPRSARKRRTPMFEPPSNRITTSASVTIRWTSSMRQHAVEPVDRRPTRPQRRRGAGPPSATARRPATIRTPIARSSRAEAKRITRPKSMMSPMVTILHCRPAGRAACRGAGGRLEPRRRLGAVPASAYTFLTPVSPRTHASSRYFMHACVPRFCLLSSSPSPSPSGGLRRPLPGRSRSRAGAARSCSPGRES